MISRRGLRIGITIGLRAPDEDLWNNGIKQNALFLAKLFGNSAHGHSVLLLNTTDVPIDDRLAWSQADFPTRPFDLACDDLDLIIELGGQISPDQTTRIKASGTRLVSYCCGPEYAQNIEAMIFSRHMYSDTFINQDYDELWVIPQIWDLNIGFLKAFRNCPARRVPFVWDPFALRAVAAGLPDGGEYRPTGLPKRLSVIEPNIDVLKFCLYPILIAELAFRQAPSDIGFLHVANAERFVHDNKEFVSLMRRLGMVQSHKASFIGRVRTPDFLAQHTDIVVSHQWGLPLNYAYLECCWQGYPLIHNAELIPELGYYYEGSDIEAGAEQLLQALRSHDDDWQSYRDRQRSLIGRFLTTNVDLISYYDDLMFGLAPATCPVPVN